jgi:hypothetical protein
MRFSKNFKIDGFLIMGNLWSVFKLNCPAPAGNGDGKVAIPLVLSRVYRLAQTK